MKITLIISFVLTYGTLIKDLSNNDNILQWVVFIMYVVMGAFAKICYEKGVKEINIKRWRVIAIFVLAFCACIITQNLLISFDWQRHSFWVIPLMALLSEVVITTILSNASNWIKNLGDGAIQSALKKIDNKVNKDETNIKP